MYVDMHAQTWPRSPGINVATRKSWSCCLSWCSFAECGSKSTLISGGVGGCAQGPVHCRWRYACLCIACGSHVCCRTARASLHLLKRSFGLRCDADPFLGLWACMLFAFLHCVPCMYIYIYCIYVYILLVFVCHIVGISHTGSQWIGWWENLQESPIFDGKNHGFL